MFHMICLCRRFFPLLFQKLPCCILFCLFLYSRTRQNPRATRRRSLRPRIRIQSDIFSLFSSCIRQAFVRRCLSADLSSPPCLYIYFRKRNVPKSLYQEENIFFLLYFSVSNLPPVKIGSRRPRSALREFYNINGAAQKKLCFTPKSALPHRKLRCESKNRNYSARHIKTSDFKRIIYARFRDFREYAHITRTKPSGGGI